MEKCRVLDCFCYVCGHIVPKNERRNLTAGVMKVYKDYFPNEMNLSNEIYTPNTLCLMCYTHLLSWSKGENKYLTFMTPVMWMEDREGHNTSRYCTIVSTVPLNQNIGSVQLIPVL